MTDRHIYSENQPSRVSRDEFLAIFGGVYEHSPWIAEKVYDTKLKDVGGLTDAGNDADALHELMAEAVNQSGREPQLALLRAHPDLAGKLAVRGELTEESTSEQASADLGNCTPEEFAEFQKLNDTYKEKFGFPFILAVRGYHRTDILEIFRARVNNDPETEFNEALTQVHRIALLRLKEIK